MVLAALTRSGVRHSWRRWLVACAGIVLVLRAPWFGAPLGTDEGGMAMVAENWDPNSPYPYGPYWLDRPPLLVLLYRVAVLAFGDVGLRILGAIAAVLLVLIVATLARRLGGEGVGRIAAALTALLAGSAAIESVFTPGELLAVVPSAAAMLCLVLAVRGHRHPHALLAAAGALAVAALLIKQSFGDALAAGAVVLTWLVVTRRADLTWPAAFAAGAAAPLGALLVWTFASHVGGDAMAYTLIGFRLDGVDVLADEHVGTRVARIALPAIGSGLVLLVPAVARGLRAAPERLAIGVWLAGGLVGVLAGGSYWPHYLIQLVPVVAVLAAIGLVTRTARYRRVVLAAVAALALGGFGVGSAVAGSYHRDDEAIAGYIRDHASPGDTVNVLYARAGLVHKTGLRSPNGYQWSLMLRTIPAAQAQLDAQLASRQRPTWLVRWDDPYRYGVGPQTERLVRRFYRPVATVNGRAILLRRDVDRRLGLRCPCISGTTQTSRGD